MRRSILLALLTLPTTAFATDYVGADLAGGNLTLSDGDTVTGTFTNVNEVTLPAKNTVTVAPGAVLEIYATRIVIEGTLDATGAGEAGGRGGTANLNNATNGEGTGGGDFGRYGRCTYGGGGGGAGYAGAGGDAGYYYANLWASGLGGTTYGLRGHDGEILLGSGGGGAGTECNTAGVAGGAGGGGVFLSADEIVINGEISVDGEAGIDDPTTDANGGSGGGSGGTLVIDSCNIVGSGTLSANGGNGGDAGGAGSDNSGGGGGGGGGRVKLLRWSLSAGLAVETDGGREGTDFSTLTASSWGRSSEAGGDGSFLDSVIDNDCDGDKLNNSVDNCPFVANPLQADTDSDGIGDLCDPCPTLDDPFDTDGDEACDGVDICDGFDDRIDTDFDKVPDGCDRCPLDALDDSDGDGTCDSNDSCPGFDDFGTDDDGDSVADACDNCIGYLNTAQVDSDADGYGDVCDCGPLDELQFPGADERCNDADDNCNGINDENPIDAPTYYLDADGDGQGTLADTLETCDPPGGAYVLNADDCDDSDDDVYVGAFEVCDGAINDCANWTDGNGDGDLDPSQCSDDGGGQPLEPRPEATGCSSTGLAPSALLLLLAPFAIRRRRR